MITVLYQLNQLGYGGTEKAILTFIRNIDKKRFAVKLFFVTDRHTSKYYRRKLFALFSQKYKKIFNRKYVTDFIRRKDFEEIIGENNIFLGTKKDFFRICSEIKPDIIHFNRGIENEFYTKQVDLIPQDIRLCETNIFGAPSSKDYLVRLSSIFFVSKWLLSKSKWSEVYERNVLYNPIIKPSCTNNLRRQLNLPETAIVIGRISRPGLDDGSFYNTIINRFESNEVYFLTIGASPELQEAQVNNKKAIFLPTTTSEIMLSMFYNTINILFHYRNEGETFGMNIAEAMIHGKPVISHTSEVDNAQIELLDDCDHPCGIIVHNITDTTEYYDKLNELISNSDLRLELGKNGKTKALQTYEESLMTKQLESLYKNIVSN